MNPYSAQAKSVAIQRDPLPLDHDILEDPSKFRFISLLVWEAKVDLYQSVYYPGSLHAWETHAKWRVDESVGWVCLRDVI